MIGACGHYLDTDNPDLCSTCAAQVRNVETPYWQVAGLDDPHERDMFHDWRSRVPHSPTCPRCTAAPIFVEHVATGKDGEEFCCGPCGAIITVSGYRENGSYDPSTIKDTGKTAPRIPTYEDDGPLDREDEPQTEYPASPISYAEWERRFRDNLRKLREQ